MFLKLPEISNSNKATVRREVELLVKKRLRDGCCLYFVSSLIRNFLAKADISSVLLKLSLPVFLKFFVIFVLI